MRRAHATRLKLTSGYLDRHSRRLGIAAAAVIVTLAIVHLFRIDTLVPIVQDVLPFPPLVTAMIVALIVVLEVASVPVLVQMHLGRISRVLSAICVAAAPLAWLLIAIWAYGGGLSTGQLGQFYELPSTALLILADSLWLGYNVIALWALGLRKIAWSGHPRG